MNNFAKNILYPFCPNISWDLDCGIIKPFLSRNIFNNIKEQAKSFSVIFPGYLLESLIAVKANEIFINSGIKINNWIMPNVYSKALSIFNFNYKGTTGNIFNEYNRIKEAVDSYPVPIFMDKDYNIYFNLLFNYGKRVNFRNNPTKDNLEPFWKQILKNTLMFDNYKFKEYEFNLLNRCNNFLKYNGININKRFILLDNSNIFGIPAHGFKINNPFIFSEQARNIAAYLYNNGIQCVIMTNDKKKYYGNNLFTINTWNRIKMLDLLALLNNTYGVVSSDPNIFLSAPIMGCKNIICNDEPTQGWMIEDLKDFCHFDGKCIYGSNIKDKDMVNFFKES